jgi:hypothetical protein
MADFLTPNNFLGWTAADWSAAALTVLLCRIRLLYVPGWFRALAARPLMCTILLFALPICLRLALLPVAGPPIPSGADDFGYLFVADTLRHFRLANPPLPLDPVL